MNLQTTGADCLRDSFQDETCEGWNHGQGMNKHVHLIRWLSATCILDLGTNLCAWVSRPIHLTFCLFVWSKFRLIWFTFGSTVDLASELTGQVRWRSSFLSGFLSGFLSSFLSSLLSNFLWSSGVLWLTGGECSPNLKSIQLKNLQKQAPMAILMGQWYATAHNRS